MANSDSFLVLKYFTPAKPQQICPNFNTNNKFSKLQLKKPFQEPSEEIIDLTEETDSSESLIVLSSLENSSIESLRLRLSDSKSCDESLRVDDEKESSASVISGTQQSSDNVEDSCSDLEKFIKKPTANIVIDESSSFATESTNSRQASPSKDTDTSLLSSDTSNFNQENLITSDDSAINRRKSSDQSNISSNDEQFTTALSTPSDSILNMDFTTPKPLKRYSEFKSTNKNPSDGSQPSTNSETFGNEILLDERTEEILNELYGDTWRNTPGFKTQSQTPQTVIKKPPKDKEKRATKSEKKKKLSPTNLKFKDFSSRIRPDLESTRSPFSKKIDFHSSFLADSDSEIENDPAFYNTILQREKDIFQEKPRSLNKKYQNIKQSLANVCDSDSDDALFDKYKSFSKPSSSDLLDRFEQLKISNPPKSNTKRKLLPLEQASIVDSPPENLRSFEMPVCDSPFTFCNGVLTDLGRKKTLYRKTDSLELKRVEENEQLRKVTGSDRKNEKKTKKLETPKVPRKNLQPVKLIESDHDSDSWSDMDFPSTKPSETKTKTLSFLASLSANVDPSRENSEARKFKQNFTKTRDQLVKRLFDLYNETVFDNKIPSTTPIEWNPRLRGTAGTCHNKKIIKGPGETLRTCRIVLSTKVLDMPYRVRDTLLHEMCHAIVWLVDGYNDGHGPRWKYWALKAMRTHPDIPSVKRCHNYEIHKKFLYKCVKCGYTIGRHSKSLDTEKKRCGYCYGKFELFINKKGKDGAKVVTETVGATPNSFAMFVKDNYKNVKKPDLKHGDVMKILGQQFSAMKMKEK